MAGSMSKAMPARIGRYQIEATLGGGALGMVFRAWDPQLVRPIAIKQIRPEHIRAPLARERLLQEVRTLAKVSHPNVLPIYDGGLFEEQFFVVMELVEGRSLHEWLLESTRSSAEILETFAAAGRGLAAAHMAGLVHRHFKASDVLMAFDGRILVVDFGLTPAILKPVLQDVRTDQRDFCVALRDALEIPAGAQKTPRVLAKVGRAIQRGMSRRAEDRFASMEQLLTELLLALPKPRRKPGRGRRTALQPNIQTAPDWHQSLFVGREGELLALSKILRTRAQGVRVLFVHGPGGVGKTSVLYQFSRLGELAGVPSVLLDMRDIPASPSAFSEALAQGMGLSPAALVKDWPVYRQLVLLDTFEATAALEGWLREVFLPQLPAQTVFIVASRTIPALAWTTDPGWRSLFHKLPLSDLSLQESEEYLRRRHIPPEQQRDIVAFAHGHPLALSLVADVVGERPGETFRTEQANDVVQTLIERLVQNVPSAEHRAALEACAVARTTTESSLRAMLKKETVHPLYSWLRGLSFVQMGKSGIYPHDVAREALLSDLRVRDPARLQLLRTQVFEFCNKRVHLAMTLSEQHQATLDHLFLFRDDPTALRFSNSPGMQELTTEVATSKDWDELLAMVQRHEGSKSAAIAAHWLRRQPDSALVIRRPNFGQAAVGFMMTLDLERTTAAERGRDPAAEAAWAHLVRRNVPLRGRALDFKRFWMDRDCYQDLSAVQGVCNVASLRYLLSHPDLAYTFVAYAHPERYAALFAKRRYERLTELDFEVDGKRYGMFGRDWREEPPILWRWRDMNDSSEV